MHQAPDSRFGMRFSWCYVGDLCEVRNVFKKLHILNIFVQPIHGWYYSDVIKYREATTKKEQCKLAILSEWGSNPPYDKLPIEKMMKEYHEYCPKSISNNIVFCPEKIIKRKKDEKVQWINDYFKNFETKINKKRRGKKKRKSKSNTNEEIKEIKEQVNNIKDIFNIKLNNIDINIRHDINDKLNDIETLSDKVAEIK